MHGGPSTREDGGKTADDDVVDAALTKMPLGVAEIERRKRIGGPFQWRSERDTTKGANEGEDQKDDEHVGRGVS